MAAEDFSVNKLKDHAISVSLMRRDFKELLLEEELVNLHYSIDVQDNVRSWLGSHDVAAEHFAENKERSHMRGLPGSCDKFIDFVLQTCYPSKVPACQIKTAALKAGAKSSKQASQVME